MVKKLGGGQQQENSNNDEMIEHLMMGYETQVNDLKEQNNKESKELRDEIR